MKRLFLLVIFIALCCSCKKENELNDLKNKITGTWELERNVCGMCPTPVTIYPPGSNNLIILYADGSFERKKQDTLLFKGTYSLQKNKECNATAGDDALTTNEYSSAWFITCSNNKLELSIPYCYTDGATNTYRRIK